MTDAIALRGVHKAFAGRTALADLHLQVAAGELHGFVGPNGAGKTTALRMLVGLVRRDGGDAHVLGLDPEREALAIRHRTSYLPGETNVYAHLTGAEYLDFALSFYPRADADLQRQLLAAWELPLAARVRTYSAGMKQKLALIATLVPDVEVYLLDEPDRALDASVRFYLREVLRGLHARGKTILFSSHHLAEVEALAQRLTFVIAGVTVPPERVQAARDALRRVLRLRLRQPGAPLPPGARVATIGSDGMLEMVVDGEPLGWLARLDPALVDCAELGTTRLEDLYQQLTEQVGEQAPAAAPGTGGAA